MGRHSGARCSACEQIVRVRDDRLVEHRHLFPSLGTSLACVGSHVRAAPDADTDGRWKDAGATGAHGRRLTSARVQAVSPS